MSLTSQPMEDLSYIHQGFKRIYNESSLQSLAEYIVRPDVAFIVNVSDTNLLDCLLHIHEGFLIGSSVMTFAGLPTTQLLDALGRPHVSLLGFIPREGVLTDSNRWSIALDDRPVFAVRLPAATLADAIGKSAGMLFLGNLYTIDYVKYRCLHEYSALLGYAVILNKFLSTTKYCCRCAQQLTPRTPACIALRCLRCSVDVFLPTSPCVIGITTWRDKALFHHRHSNLYTHIAGYIEPGETANVAMIRELNEEVGQRVNLCDAYMLKIAQPWPSGQSLMLCFHNIVHGAEEPPIDLASAEADDAFWADKNEYLRGVENERKMAEGDFTKEEANAEPRVYWVPPDRNSVARFLYDTFFFGNMSTLM